MRVLNQQLVAFGNIAKEITKTYGKAVVDTPVAIMSEQAWHRMEGHPFPDMIQTPQQQAWLENNMVLVERCDFKMYCHYFEMWDALKRLPITESVVDYVSHFPCRYCEISIKVLRTQDRILSREETKKFFDQYPSLKELMDSVFEKHQTILEKKVMERSKQMEKGEY
jgi:hypothetical protein